MPDIIFTTLALKPMGRVNRSPKQRVPVVPQNDDLSLQRKLQKIGYTQGQ